MVNNCQINSSASLRAGLGDKYFGGYDFRNIVFNAENIIMTLLWFKRAVVVWLPLSLGEV